MRMNGGLQLITSNPVTDAYNASQKRMADQEAADLQNAINRQSYTFNAEEHPLKLRGITANTETLERTNQFGKDTYQNDITKSNNEAMKSGVDLGQAQENLSYSQQAHPLDIRSKGAQAETDESQARVQTSTEGSQISQANSQAVEAAARAKVAQNGAAYDLEGRWVDLLSKNPQMAIAQAAQYQVPPELVAIAQDQSKVKWLTDAWSNIVAQYPNATDAATRAAIFEEKLKSAGPNPSATSAFEVPAGAPPPTTRMDELKGMAQQLGLKPGTRDYVTFIQSDGKTLPGSNDPADIKEYLYAKSPEGGNFPGSYVDWVASKKGQGLSVQLPDGTIVQQGGSVKPPNESQMQAGNRAQLIQDGVARLEKLYDDPNINAWNVGAADTVSAFGPLGRVAGSEMKSDAEQQFSAAKAAALEGMAASITGAGVTKDQFDRYTQMLPDITDKPETRKAKLKAANDYLGVILANAGAAGNPVKRNMEQNGDMARIPSFTDPNDPALKALPSGSQFYSDDGNGNKTLRFVP